MSEEQFRKLCREEFLKNIKENIKSETIFVYIDELEKENKKQKEVLDKIKEYITTRTPSDIGISGNKPKKYYTLNEDEVDYILKLLEETK